MEPILDEGTWLCILLEIIKYVGSYRKSDLCCDELGLAKCHREIIVFFVALNDCLFGLTDYHIAGERVLSR